MSEAYARHMIPRGLVALAIAAVMAVPMGFGVPSGSAAPPMHRVLLGTSGDTLDVARAVDAAGGRVVQTFEIAQALVVDLPKSVTAPMAPSLSRIWPCASNAVPTAVAGSDERTPSARRSGRRQPTPDPA